jgi:outer membrane protein OmpA-like peptidoglycan-associated protein
MAMSTATPVAAQTPQAALPLNRFNPSAAGDRFFSVDSPYAGEHLAIHGMLMGDYAHSPLVIVQEGADDDTDLGDVVEHQMYLHLNGSFGLFERVAVNVDIPIAIVQSGDDPTGNAGQQFQSPSGADFGDLRLGARVRLWGDYYDAFQVGLGGYIWVPTGNSEPGSFVSSGDVRGMPKVLLGGIRDRFVWSFATGPEFRASDKFGQVDQGSLFHFGGAAGYMLGDDKQIQIGPEVNVALVLEDVQKRTTNAEGLVGAKWRFLPFMEAGIGIGPGFSSGIGTPDFRGVFSIAYTPKVEEANDRDGDGILDQNDACPDTPGVPSDDPAKHGCPPSDRDKDTILDADDACPDTPGPASDDPAKHGCPDKDGDGIIDKNDACVDLAGPPNEDKAKHGCPDKDGDGIIDPKDACPEEAGPANDDPKKHGCPALDSDGDGIADESDACPQTPGVASEDPKKNGCPPDTDGDGILDADDACPKQKGLPNNDPKKHGCPKVIVTDKEVVILERIEFDTGKATIKQVSLSIVEAVANVLIEHPEIKKIEVQGHTDDRGSNWANKTLSNRRAASVMKALIERGVDKARITSKGYGEDVTIADNKTAEGRQKNRRVQFKITEKAAKKPAPAPAPAPTKASAPAKPAPKPAPAGENPYE